MCQTSVIQNRPTALGFHFIFFYRHSFAGLVFFGALLISSVVGQDRTPQTVAIDGISIPYRSVTISSPVQEILAEVFVEEGDTVKTNQPLAQLFDEKERIEFRRFEKLLEKRQFDQRASRNLLEKNLLSKEKALAAEAELELAQVDYDLAKTQLAEKTIKSTVDGIVIRRLVEPGESVDRIEALLEIVDIDRLTLQFYVEPEVLDHLSVGDRIPFEITGKPEKKGEAVVDFISPSADPQSGLFRIKLKADNRDRRFLAGVRVTGHFKGRVSK